MALYTFLGGCDSRQCPDKRGDLILKVVCTFVRERFHCICVIQT